MFAPISRRKVFDAIKGKEVEKSPFVNLPEGKGTHRMDGRKWRLSVATVPKRR
jgi:hypothetical protein